jgi:tagatose 6-phosphate kinase
LIRTAMIIALGTTPTVQRTMTFDRLQLDAVNRAAGVREFASGKSINVARVLNAIGEPCITTGLLGGDSGRFIRADLDRAGIRHDFVEVEQPTRLCVTVIDQSQRTATELIEESKPVARDEGDRLLAKLESLLSGGARSLVLSGTLAPGLAERFYAECIERARDRVPVILDAKGEPLDWALEQHPTIVKPNRAELAETLDADVDDEDALRGAMRQMIVRGAQWVIVTSGTRPTLVTDGRRFWMIATPQVEAINPIGSGDSLAAGLAAGVARGQDPPEACRLGVACAAANAMTPHAGHVHRTDVDALLPRIEIVSRPS